VLFDLGSVIIDDLWNRNGEILDTTTKPECQKNFFVPDMVGFNPKML